MSCSRKECESIMCDTYIRDNDIGYVCYECQAEFKVYASANNLRTEAEILNSLARFMGTPKGNYNNSPEKSVDDFFNEHRNDSRGIY